MTFAFKKVVYKKTILDADDITFYSDKHVDLTFIGI